MTPGECSRLCQQLVIDPSSHTFASVAGWSHPTSYEALALADLFDLLAAANGGDMRYPRAWATPKGMGEGRMGRTTVSPERAREILARVGPKDG